MKLKIYQVDAFTDKLFGGNPAAVCPLNEWLPDETLQNIAAENNLAETAFYVKTNNGFHLRWFTPATEVDLCGHATLATAFVLFNKEGYSGKEILFDCKSGILKVTKSGELFTLDFPVHQLTSTEPTNDLVDALGKIPSEAFNISNGWTMLVYNDQSMIEMLKPDFRKLLKNASPAFMVTAPGRESDFVSRMFAPQYGIDEDPVTGSAHCSLTPYWAKRLNKNVLSAIQISKRKGFLKCELKGERVEISGKGVLYLEGEISV